MLRATANPQGFQLKGDVKIGGAPMSLEYRKARNEAEAEVRLQGMLDEAARTNLGFEMGETRSRRHSDAALRPASPPGPIAKAASISRRI